jgi:hypothetical protein
MNNDSAGNIHIYLSNLSIYMLCLISQILYRRDVRQLTSVGGAGNLASRDISKDLPQPLVILTMASIHSLRSLSYFYICLN